MLIGQSRTALSRNQSECEICQHLEALRIATVTGTRCYIRERPSRSCDRLASEATTSSHSVKCQSPDYGAQSPTLLYKIYKSCEISKIAYPSSQNAPFDQRKKLTDFLLLKN